MNAVTDFSNINTDKRNVHSENDMNKKRPLSYSYRMTEVLHYLFSVALGGGTSPFERTASMQSANCTLHFIGFPV